MPRDLSSLFSPKSIAVIGASRTPEKVGAVVLKNIIESEFPGHIYPVNPNAENINGLPCYPDVSSLPEKVDLAVVALPATLVIDTLNQIGEKGIKNAVVFAAGFKETGAEGAILEKQLSDVAQKYGLNLLGPNCLGFLNNFCPVNVTFGEAVKQPGNLRFVTQSGAIAASLFDWCKSTGLGLSHFVTLGNKTVLNENDVLHYFQSLPPVTLQPADQEGLSTVFPIGLYLESISNGNDFLHLTSQIAQTYPLFIIKPGKTKAAAKAMQSHTGAIAGEDAVLDAVLSQAGVVRCQTLQDFFDVARAFAWENAPLGPKIAIISNAGGPAVISADAVVQEGLELAEFDAQTEEQLQKILPSSASTYNPIDILGDALADRFAQASEVILQTNQADALMIILTPQVMTQIEKTAEFIGALSKKYQKPIFCSFIGGSLIAEGEKKLNEYRIPSFRFPERAISTISAMWKWKKFLQTKVSIGASHTAEQFNTDQAKGIVAKAIEANQITLDNLQSNELITSFGIPTPPTQAVAQLEEAKQAAGSIGWPVVLKLSAPGLLHKKAVGGVVTDIWNENHLETACNELQYKISQLDQEIRDHVRIQVQKDVVNGIEVIVGVKKDPTFGQILLFGAGGSMAELIADRNLHLLPMDIPQIKHLVEGSKIFPLLKGNGEPALALEKLYNLIYRLGKLAENIPDISEIEINPVIVTLNDVWAVDAKVLLTGETNKVVKPSPFKIATTISHTILASHYHEFVFESEQQLVYKPGQYISIKVANDRINCYSIAGQESPNRFNLLVDTSPGGPGSKFFENLKVGDKITYLGPFGIFTFKPDDGASQVLFLGTGSGCSPLRCMLDGALKQNAQTPMTLYFGLRHSSDVFWKDYFEKLTQQYPNFKYKLVLSKPDTGWQGQVGHITDLVNSDFPDASGCSAYLCGNKQMVEQATEILQAQGCPKERIYSEKF